MHILNLEINGNTTQLHAQELMSLLKEDDSHWATQVPAMS